MKHHHATVIALALLASTGCGGEQGSYPNAAPPSVQHIAISSAGPRPPKKGVAENFTGSVLITPRFCATRHTRASGGSVTFDPGARSRWHSHPAGQTLIVTAGTGWVQEWGAPKQEIKPGDVVWTPPGVKHWHGATATENMTHIAIQEQVDGRAVDWMEEVSVEQYRN
jgi:quercetin dioxygenase-like cupin family protein